MFLHNCFQYIQFGFIRIVKATMIFVLSCELSPFSCGSKSGRVELISFSGKTSSGISLSTSCSSSSFDCSFFNNSGGIRGRTSIIFLQSCGQLESMFFFLLFAFSFPGWHNLSTVNVLNHWYLLIFTSRTF